MAAGQAQSSGGTDINEGPLIGNDPNGTPAVRIFSQDSTVLYGYEIFNAHLDRNKKLQLEVQARLFRDGESIHDGTPSALKTDGQLNPGRLAEVGALQLNQLPPGEYVLQLIVTDKLASEKFRIASQSMDFEVR